MYIMLSIVIIVRSVVFNKTLLVFIVWLYFEHYT